MEVLCLGNRKKNLRRLVSSSTSSSFGLKILEEKFHRDEHELISSLHQTQEGTKKLLNVKLSYHLPEASSTPFLPKNVRL